MLFRLVFVTLLFGSAVLVNANEAASFGDASSVAILALIVATYGATLGYALALRSDFDPAKMVVVQLVVDTFLAAGVVFLTGGVDSIFMFLFFLSVFNGAILLGRNGASVAASASALGLAAVVVLQHADLPPVVGLFPETDVGDGRVPVYATVIDLVAFYTVALLSGQLSEKLGQIGTELERKKLDLRELRTLNEDIVRSVDVGLISVDLDGRVIFMNRAAEELTGRSFAHLAGGWLTRALPALAREYQALGGSAAGRAFRAEVTLERPAGTSIPVALTVSTLRSASGSPGGAILGLQDLTEVRALEREVRRREHLAVVGKLSAGIAHEIRNPLAAISGSIEMLRPLALGNEEDRHLMDIVIHEVERLNRLIRDFLDYSRPIEVVRVPVRPRELVEDTIRMISMDSASCAARFRVEDEGAPAQIEVDGSGIRQVLWNLFRNASEAMPDGGEVVVRLGVPEGDPGGGLRIDVIDQGAGIPEAARERVFEPFFTTKPGGTGLGLATCHHIVAEHGGGLTLESGAAGGAHFRVVLPAATRRVYTGPLVAVSSAPETPSAKFPAEEQKERAAHKDRAPLKANPASM